MNEHQCHDFARNISPESRSPPRLSPVRLLVRPWPYRVAPAAGESCGAHICPIPCSLCYLMPSHVHPYPYGPQANVATLPAPIYCTYARSKWAVRSCKQGLLFEHFFLRIQNFRQGGNAWNLFDFNNQSAANFCVHTIK